VVRTKLISPVAMTMMSRVTDKIELCIAAQNVIIIPESFHDK
jgi:hypothetical protein